MTIRTGIPGWGRSPNGSPTRDYRQSTGFKGTPWYGQRSSGPPTPVSSEKCEGGVVGNSVGATGNIYTKAITWFTFAACFLFVVLQAVQLVSYYFFDALLFGTDLCAFAWVAGAALLFALSFVEQEGGF
ncbi:MAG: hypothetical protein CO141_04435 [Candidatus Moranbacteria bacterium CG_4_9_14_3_um_filter_42_9]|nr:MAG: hypothetical protein CO141_04435 [Candidatus Moranbacteria bacterium CG_4_9_14_3_um_filter_42_9]